MLERILHYNAGLLLKHRKQGHEKITADHQHGAVQWHQGGLSVS